MRFLFHPKWGIRIITVWAASLALLALVYLLILINSVEFYSNQSGNQFQVWLVFGFNIAFTLGFGAAAYGLWLERNWGRLLFLWVIGVWSVFNILSLLVPGMSGVSARQFSTVDLALNVFRFAVTLLIPAWYLNRPRIKSLFADAPATNSTAQEVTPHDNLT
jgi:hypothetical protein